MNTGTWIAKKTDKGVTWVGFRHEIQLTPPGPYKCELWAEADGEGAKLALIEKWDQEANPDGTFTIRAFTINLPAQKHYHAQFKVYDKAGNLVFDSGVVKVEIT